MIYHFQLKTLKIDYLIHSNFRDVKIRIKSKTNSIKNG